jgi:predicted ATP-dependent endonuclease of OLD family
MHVDKVHISGFRSIAPSAILDFDMPERGAASVVEVNWPRDSFSFELRRDRRGRDLTGIVGANNAGKSNVLRALLLFFSNLDSDEKSVKIEKEVDFHCYTPENEGDMHICIEILFLLEDPEVEDLEEYMLSQNAAVENSYLSLGCVWDLNGSAHWYYRLAQDENTVEELGPDLRVAALKNIAQHMPRFYWLPTGADTSKEQKIRGSKYLKTLIDDVLQEIKDLRDLDPEAVQNLDEDERNLREQLSTTQEILESLRDNLEDLKQLPSPLNELASSLVSYMQPIMPGVAAWFEYSSALPDDYWKWLNVSMIRLDDGWPTSISEKGHGSQRTFAIALLRTYAEYKAQRIGSHPFLLAIEEPEIYMHPHIARALSSTLQDLALNGQVLFSTHSPTFVKPLDWENLILVKKPENRSISIQIQPDIFTDPQREEIRRNIDAQECEMFFARHVILVEGPTEKFAIPGFVQTLQQDQTHPLDFTLDEMGITIVDVGGKNNFTPFLVLLNHFDISISMLIDSDAIGDVPSQLLEAELIMAEERDEFNGMDIDDKRDWLFDKHCVVLEGDFEIEIARSLDNNRIWQVVNEARSRKGLPAENERPFPGENEAQIGDMLHDWKRALWKGVKRSIKREERAQYKDRIMEELPEDFNRCLRKLAAELIDEQHWATNSREKWLASKMSRQGKPLVGLVLGDTLTAEEVRNCTNLMKLLDSLGDYDPRP